MKPAALYSRIPEKDWEQTPTSVKAVIEELVGRVEHLNEKYTQLSSQMSPLAEQMGELEVKLGRQKRVSRPGKRGFKKQINSL